MRIKDFTRCVALEIQNVCLIVVSVLFVLAWNSLQWALWMIIDVRGWFGGNKYGNLIVLHIGALWILPPQRINPPSMNRQSCLTSDNRLQADGRESILAISL